LAHAKALTENLGWTPLWGRVFERLCFVVERKGSSSLTECQMANRSHFAEVGLVMLLTQGSCEQFFERENQFNQRRT
jgi:hypothetical protein